MVITLNRAENVPVIFSQWKSLDFFDREVSFGHPGLTDTNDNS